MFLIIYGFTSKRMIEEAMKGSHLHPWGTPVNARQCAENTPWMYGFIVSVLTCDNTYVID